MLLTLYDQYGSVKAALSPNDTSTQDKEVQGDNVLSLTFTLYEYVGIDVNDYVDFEGERYWAVEKYLPNEKSTVEWEYNVKLYGIESLIKRFLVLKTVDGGNEAVFTLTARPIEHMRLIVQNINDGMGGETKFKVGTVEGTDNVVIDYTGKYCDEGLKELAEKVGVEWWIEGETVNLCRCEHGEELTLGYGNGLTSLDRDVADNAKFYTRLFPIGSSRNIDPEKYGASRLQLPGGVKYVDVNADRYGVIHHYEQEAFSGIYPRRVGVVSSVRNENVTDTDGNPFTIYYFKDSRLTFDPNDYEIGGLVKHVSFQEGSELAGLGADDDHYFEVNYNSETREFEIITIWPYDDDTQLPGGTLVPKVGDRYILWNIRMPDEYYGLAEREFQSAVNEYNAKHALDVSRYKAPTDHVWIEDEGVDLYIGRRIRLESQEYFPDTGYRKSRVTRISRQVTLPSQMELEISDALSTRTLEKIDDAISDVKNYTGTLVGSVNVPDIIKSGDTTRPTDNNLYSARRSHKEFLSKNGPDRAAGFIEFLSGLKSDELAEFVRGIKADAPSQFLKGLSVGQNGETTLSPDGMIDTLGMHVHGGAIFDELVVNRQRVREAIEMFTEGGIVDGVEPVAGEPGRWALTFRKEHENDRCKFVRDDVIRQSVNNLDTDGTFRVCWFRAIADPDLTTNTLTVTSYDGEDCPGGMNFPPVAGGHSSRWGNATDRTRQTCWYLDSYEGTFVMLDGVTAPTISTKAAYIGKASVIKRLYPDDLRIQDIDDNKPILYGYAVAAEHLINVSYRGVPDYQPREWPYWDGEREYVKGFDTDEERYVEDRVWHGGCLFAVAVPKATVGREPSRYNPDYVMLRGLGDIALEIRSSAGTAFEAGVRFQTTLDCTVWNAEMILDERDIGVENIWWERQSGKPADDQVWNVMHNAPSRYGLSLPIDSLYDIPQPSAAGEAVTFWCFVRISGTDYHEKYSI